MVRSSCSTPFLKLKENGISGSLLKLFQNHSSNRKQYVVLNGSYSDYSDVYLKALFLVPIISYPISGNYNLISTQRSRQLKSYFLVKYLLLTIQQLTFDGTVVGKVNEQKHLGFILDTGITFR